MTATERGSGRHTRVVIGVDGSGRSHRLDAIAERAKGPVLRVAGGRPVPDLGERLQSRDAGDEPLVLVDDAHLLDEPTTAVLLEAARGGVSVVLARRPTLTRPDLAALEELVAADGAVETLQPLDDEGIADVAVEVTGRQPSPDLRAALLRASGGLPAVAVPLLRALATPKSGEGGKRPAPPELVALVHRRLVLLPAAAADVSRVLALGLSLNDDALAAAAGVPPGALPDAMRALRDAGMLLPGQETLIPVVAQLVRSEQPAAQRRVVHERLGRALLATGSDPLAIAEQLRAARARTPEAARAFAAAAELVRWREPAAAMEWLDAAVDAGHDAQSLAPVRAEAATLLGRPVPLAPEPDDGVGAVRRLTMVAGAVEAREGRTERCAAALRAAGPPGDVLAVPALAAVGRLDAVPDVDAGVLPDPLRRFAAAAVAAVSGPDAAAALPALIEAAETAERTPPSVVLPETPHALGALVAVTAGDVATAEHLLTSALAAAVGGPAAGQRHRLLLAWARMRTGRYDTAVEELRGLAAPTEDTPALGGRERLLRAAVAAGLARRRGDIAALRTAWAEVEPALARRTVDLFAAEPVEELLVAAARLRQQQRIAPVLSELDDITARLRHPAGWAAVIAWIRLQVAVVVEDVDAAAAAAGLLHDIASAEGIGERIRAQAAAAAIWAAALGGRVDGDAVLAGVEGLAGPAQLPWEGSRLAGQAAIRATDPRVTRRLLERARDLAGEQAAPAPAGVAAPGPSGDSRLAGLSEREVEVAQLVLAGRTYREIGAQLYIAPKTVEHHVARIRAKLGAESRAEFVAALRSVLGEA